jgi:hypothetical protein
VNKAAPNLSEGSQATIWQELDEWAREFKPWQRYIVGYLVREGKLSEDRVTDAYALFLSEHGLAKTQSADIEIPPTITGRPISAAPAPIHITRVCNLTSINALPTEADLTFSPGLTVIYGGNGAGKSGFVRIFSNACFSRAQHRILPDISRIEPPAEPGADISISMANEKATTIRFDDRTEHSELKRIAVFDAAVARVHLSVPNALGFQPIGFDIFTEMAKCYGEITRRIDEGIFNRKRDNIFPKSFTLPESEVSRLVSNLTHDTDLEPIRAAARFGQNEMARVEEIQRQIGELQARSVAEAIEQLQNAGRDFWQLLASLKNAIETLGEERRSSYRTQVADLIFRRRVVLEQGATSFKTEFLKTVGGFEWEDFVASARHLADLEHDGYPHLDDRCLFCQQPLSSDAHALIHRIWAFLGSEARTQAHNANELVDGSIKILDALKLEFFAPNTTCYAHMLRLNPSLAQKVTCLVEQITRDYYDITTTLYDAAAHDETKRTIPQLSWDSIEVAMLLGEIDALSGQIDLDVARLRDQNPEEALEALNAERANLRHRQILNQLLPDIEKYVEDLRWIEVASGPAKRSLNSRPLTIKETELFTKVVAEGYRRQLSDECEELDCMLPIEFKTEGQKGQTLRSLSMKGGYSPDQILSEGEQRAVALADFLTEIGLNAANAGIILDDPVTSQDHQRKGNIAARLVKESKRRQVIILTHDLLFLTKIAAEASEQDVDILTHWIERDSNGRPGQISLDDSPATTPQYRDTRKAKATLAEAKATSGSSRVKLIQRGMGELRRTVEEIVPYFLLKQTVNRWSDRIMVTALRKVNWDDVLVEDIIKTFEELSAYIEGHSHTEQTAEAPPEPSDFEKRITQVDALIRRARSDRQR